MVKSIMRTNLYPCRAYLSTLQLTDAVHPEPIIASKLDMAKRRQKDQCEIETKRIGHISICSGKLVRSITITQWTCYISICIHCKRIRKVGERIWTKRENNTALALANESDMIFKRISSHWFLVCSECFSW